MAIARRASESAFIVNRTDLQALSRLRRREARALLTAGYPGGAYYLVGYAVECALKAEIARQTNRHDFPDRRFAQDIHTHDLDRLLELASWREALDADSRTNAKLLRNWDTVSDWNEASRYNTHITRTMARLMYSACTARTDGILSWIMQRW